MANRDITGPAKSGNPPPMGDGKGLPNLPKNSPTPSNPGLQGAPPRGINTGTPESPTPKGR